MPAPTAANYQQKPLVQRYQQRVLLSCIMYLVMGQDRRPTVAFLYGVSIYPFHKLQMFIDYSSTFPCLASRFISKQKVQCYHVIFSFMIYVRRQYVYAWPIFVANPYDTFVLTSFAAFQTSKYNSSLFAMS